MGRPKSHIILRMKLWSACPSSVSCRRWIACSEGGRARPACIHQGLPQLLSRNLSGRSQPGETTALRLACATIEVALVIREYFFGAG